LIRKSFVNEKSFLIRRREFREIAVVIKSSAVEC
jgi:hypothetical protein